MQTALQQSFWDRFSGVVALQRDAYEAIPRDPEATGQGWLIVLLLGLGNGIGVIVTGVSLPPEVAADVPELGELLLFDSTGEKFVAIAIGVVGALLSWYVSSWLLRIVGTRMSSQPGPAIAPDAMRRLVAWGYSPSLASFLAPIPVIGPLLALFGTLWAFVTGIMAIRVAFGVSVGKAIAIEIVAFIVILAMMFVLAAIAVTVALLLAA